MGKADGVNTPDGYRKRPNVTAPGMASPPVPHGGTVDFRRLRPRIFQPVPCGHPQGSLSVRPSRGGSRDLRGRAGSRVACFDTAATGKSTSANRLHSLGIIRCPRPIGRPSRRPRYDSSPTPNCFWRGSTIPAGHLAESGLTALLATRSGFSPPRRAMKHTRVFGKRPMCVSLRFFWE